MDQKDKRQEFDRKKQNIIIEGLAEKDRENPRLIVTSLLTKIGVTKADNAIILLTAYRLSTVNKAGKWESSHTYLVPLILYAFFLLSY